MHGAAHVAQRTGRHTSRHARGTEAQMHVAAHVAHRTGIRHAMHRAAHFAQRTGYRRAYARHCTRRAIAWRRRRRAMHGQTTRNAPAHDA